MHAKQFVTSNQEYTHAPHQLGHETKPIKFHVALLLEKNSDVGKKVKLLLEQLQVCIFAEIVFGVRCTLNCLEPVSQKPRKRFGPAKVFLVNL